MKQCCNLFTVAKLPYRFLTRVNATKCYGLQHHDQGLSWALYHSKLIDSATPFISFQLITMRVCPSLDLSLSVFMPQPLPISLTLYKCCQDLAPCL